MNPSTGTFISMDTYQGTIFDPISLHKYLYANANPVMNCDPSGYKSIAETNTAMTVSSILDNAANSVASFALAFYTKVKTSITIIAITTSPLMMLLTDNPIFVEICTNIASGKIRPQDIFEIFKEQIVKIIKDIQQKFNNVINGNPDPENWRKLLSRTQEKAIERLNNIFNDHLTPEDFDAVVRELAGEKFSKPNGGYWDHINEMINSYDGLQKSIGTLQGSLANPNLSPLISNNLNAYYTQAVEYSKLIEQMFEPYGGINVFR